MTSCFASVMLAQDTGDEFFVERLLQRYTERYGGLREANRLAAVSIEGVQNQAGLNYDFHLRKKRPGMLHYQLKRGAAVLTTVYDGQQAWLQIRQGDETSVEELAGEPLKVVQDEARFESPLYRHMDKPANRITLVGREQLGGLQAVVLRVEEPGQTSLYYLHPGEALVLRVDRLNEAGEVALQTLYRDYQEVAGYPFAHHIEVRIKGETVSVTRVNSIVVNPGLLSFYFQKPSEE
ncbi:MAG: hypothetical protein ACNA77_01690 [Opitutales bacterium]